MTNCVAIFFLGGARAAVEDQEDWLVLLGALLLLHVSLVLAKEFRVKLDVARLINTVNIAEASSDAEIWGDFDQCGVDVVNIFGLGVKGIIVNIFIVNTIFLTASDSNFLFDILSITGSEVGAV